MMICVACNRSLISIRSKLERPFPRSKCLWKTNVLIERIILISYETQIEVVFGICASESIHIFPDWLNARICEKNSKWQKQMVFGLSWKELMELIIIWLLQKNPGHFFCAPAIHCPILNTYTFTHFFKTHFAATHFMFVINPLYPYRFYRFKLFLLVHSIEVLNFFRELKTSVFLDFYYFLFYVKS